MGSSVAIRGFALAMFLLILGGLVWGWMAATGRNPLEMRPLILYATLGVAVSIPVYFFISWVGRNAFLPFLGPTVFPCGLLEDKVPEGADTVVEIQTRPGAKVLFWAAEPGAESLKTIPTWREAYASFSNAGVTTADAYGVARLQVRKPQTYTVPYKGALDAHIHYRICLSDGGLLQVETIRTGTDAAPVAEAMEEMFAAQELPQALPPDVSASVEQMPAVAMAPSPMTEGFSSETMYATADPEESKQRSLGVVVTDDRLMQVRDFVEQDSATLFDDFAFAEGPQVMGADFQLAYQEPVRPSLAPSTFA
jgi:hypothetical protein